MNRFIAFVVVAGLTFSLGCARVDVIRLKPGDTTTEGVRFYRPAPYLLVTVQPSPPKPDGKPGEEPKPTMQTTIVWLPDVSEEYTVSVEEGWGVANGSIELIDGWRLSKLGAIADSKAPETITAVGSLLTSIAGVAIKSTDDKGLAPGLYRIIFDKTSGHVIGVQEVDMKPLKPASVDGWSVGPEGVRVRAGSRTTSGITWRETNGRFNASAGGTITDGADMRLAGNINLTLGATRVNASAFTVGFSVSTYGLGARMDTPFVVYWQFLDANGTPVGPVVTEHLTFKCKSHTPQRTGETTFNLSDMRNATKMRVWWNDGLWTELCPKD